MGKILKVLGATLLISVLAGGSPAGAVVLDFELIGYNIPESAIYGNASSTTHNLIITFSADSNILIAANPQPVATLVPATFSYDVVTASFSGPVSNLTVSEDGSSQDIVTYTANPFSISGGPSYQLVASGWFPENFLSFDWLGNGVINTNNTTNDSARLTLLPINQNTAVYYQLTGSATVASVPEPSTLLLLGSGLLGLVGYGRKRMKR